MKRKTTFAAGLCLGLLLIAAGSAGWLLDEPDYEALAERLVNQSAHIQEGDNVLITGGVRDAELLENLAVHVRKLGAFPLVTLDSDRMTRRMFTDVPEKYDTQAPEFFIELAGMLDAVISVEAGEAEGLLADIPPERFAKRAKAFEPLVAAMQERGVKQVNLGNDMYPTAALAEQYGMPQEALADVFWKGVNVDYDQLQATGQAVQQMLAGGQEVHITHPNGTDLRVRIEGRPAFVSDGVISEEDVQKGGAATQVWLPAGEVYLAPVPGTAEGTVVADRHFFQGEEIQGLTLTFEGGKLTSMTAESGLEPLQAMFDAAGEGKEAFAVVDVGINPNVSIPQDSRMLAWMPAGMVTVGFGNNMWAGGENNTTFGLGAHLPGTTLTVDDVVLVEGGVLQPPAARMNASDN